MTSSKSQPSSPTETDFPAALGVTGVTNIGVSDVEFADHFAVDERDVLAVDTVLDHLAVVLAQSFGQFTPCIVGS